MGTPFDQTASGLMWYTTVWGLELTSVADVRSEPLRVGVPFVPT